MTGRQAKHGVSSAKERIASCVIYICLTLVELKKTWAEQTMHVGMMEADLIESSSLVFNTEGPQETVPEESQLRSTQIAK